MKWNWLHFAWYQLNFLAGIAADSQSVCRNFSLCARDEATHTHVFHTDKYTHSSTVVDFMSASSMKAASPFLSLTFHFLSPSLSLSLFLSPLLSHSLLLLLTLYAILCLFSACGVGNPLLSCFVFFPLLWIFVSISWWEKSPADLALLFLVFSSFSLSLAMSPGSKHWTSHSASLWIRHFLCISPLLRGTGTRLSPLSLPLPLRLLHLYLLCFTSRPLAS